MMPILLTLTRIVGYLSAHKAIAEVVRDLLENGIKKITNNAPAFVNFDYNIILSDMIELIDPKYLVVEIIEDTPVDLKLLNMTL